MTFKMNDLSLGDIIKIDGVSHPAVRRVIPIPRLGSNFQKTTLSRPMRIGLLAIEIYGTSAPWALLAEWNGWPVGQYVHEHIPRGTVVLHMSLDKYREIVRRERLPSLAGAGEIDLEDLG